MTFEPFLTTFPGSRFIFSHFLPFRDWQVCCAYGTHVDNTDQVPVFIKRTSILQEVQFKVSDL